VNIVVVEGVLARPVARRELPSGEVQASLELGGLEGAPVPVVAADQLVPELEVGARVLVSGSVRKRFFRAGGATQSRTEVVADMVVPAGDRRRGRRLRERAAQAVLGGSPT